MEEVKCSWEEFKKETEKISISLKDKKNSRGRPLRLLFRGQADPTWKLRSSLEREREKEGFTLTEYLKIIEKVYETPIDSSFTKFNLNKHILNCIHTRDPFFDYIAYLRHHGVLDYMIYLRHHGFPTPLLDWTELSYVAAFFAFEKQSKNEHAAIFTYIETINEGKGGCLDIPNIELIITDSRAHSRHINQKAHYTVCSRLREDREFCSHELFFDPKINPYLGQMENQDIYKKFLIPSHEREKILLELSEKKINKEQLFSTDIESAEDIFFKKLTHDFFRCLN